MSNSPRIVSKSDFKLVSSLEKLVVWTLFDNSPLILTNSSCTLRIFSSTFLFTSEICSSIDFFFFMRKISGSMNFLGLKNKIKVIKIYKNLYYSIKNGNRLEMSGMDFTFFKDGIFSSFWSTLGSTYGIIKFCFFFQKGRLKS